MGRTKGSKNKPKPLNKMPGMEDIPDGIMALPKKEWKKFNDALNGKKKRGRPKKSEFEFSKDFTPDLSHSYKPVFAKPKRNIRKEVSESKYAEYSICTACKNNLKNCHCII